MYVNLYLQTKRPLSGLTWIGSNKLAFRKAGKVFIVARKVGV